MNQCPCCSHTLLKHWKNNQIYWYCSACRQEMPNLELTGSLETVPPKIPRRTAQTVATSLTAVRTTKKVPPVKVAQAS